MVVDTHARRWQILAVLSLSVFLVVVDNTVVNVALPSLARNFHASNSALQWIVDGYSLPFAALLLLGGDTGDRFGRKRVIVSAMGFFALFSLYASYTHSSGQLIVARALMGSAAAFIFPATLSLLTVTFTNPRERATAFGIWGATSGIAVAVGPILGGALVTHYWFGSIFLVNLPIAAVAISLGLWLLPESHGVAKKIDLPGLSLGTIGVTATILATIEGPTWHWTSPRIIGLYVVALLVLGAFITVETRQKTPMLDVRVFRHAAFSAGAASIAVNFFALFGFIFLVTQYFQFVRGYSAFSSGVHTLPFAITAALVTPVSAIVAAKIGPRYVVPTGLVFFAVGLSWIGTQSATASYFGPVVGSMVVISLGFSLVNAPSTNAVMGSLPVDQIGAGAAVNETTRELGGTVGVAVVGSVFTSLFSPAIITAFAPAHLSRAIASSASSSMQAALATEAHLPAALAAQIHPAVTSAFMNAFHRGCFVAAGVALVMAIVAYGALPATPAAATAGH
jgi:EmrB/QacA subfamily drug resistance transporter